MRKQISIISLLVILLSIFLYSYSQKSYPTSEVNFISGKEGTITIRAIGIGINEQKAIIDAEKNAFNVILFRGLPESVQKTALVGTNENEEKERHKEYFNKFYNEERYKTFVMSSIPVSALIRHKGGEKSISIDININLSALRKDLEENNIIRKFGY